jgi:hypothetical protein
MNLRHYIWHYILQLKLNGLDSTHSQDPCIICNTLSCAYAPLKACHFTRRHAINVNNPIHTILICQALAANTDQRCGWRDHDLSHGRDLHKQMQQPTA